jgi:hypothetical protein
VKQSLRITHAEVEDDGAHLLVRIRARNESKSTVHFVSAPRALLYDPGSRELFVRLSEAGLEELAVSPTVALPPAMAAVDPGAERAIAIALPRFITRLVPGPTPRAPSLVRLPAHQAMWVTVEVGWSYRGFFREPRGGGSLRAELQKWERGIARWRGERRAAPAKEG